MNIIRFSFSLLSTLSLAGCISAYKLPTSDTDTSFIKLEKRDGKIPFGGVIMMVKVNDDFICRPGRGITGQQKMAVLSRGSAAGQFNEGGLNIEAIPSFKFLVRSVGVNSVEVGTWAADITMCDVLLTIFTEKSKSYSVLSSFGKEGCDVQVVEVGVSEVEVAPIEYQKC